MPVYKKMFVFFVALILLTGCKSKKKPSLTGEEPVEVTDFIDFFLPVNLPYQFSDTGLQKKDKDSLLISYKVFTQFVPDSMLSKVYGKGVKPKIYALGKIEVPKSEIYLFVKTVTNDKKAFFILSFNNQHQFITGMAALRPDNNKATFQSVVMDRKYTITKTVQLKNADGSTNEGKDVYILNTDSKSFMLIMTDALIDKVTELINPIDTLPRKHKLSADYGPGKMNLVSIRDGRKNDRLSFFVHFEKNNGECTGELKGEAFFKSPTVAEYREDGDPCILTFTFTSSSVTLKEENCGSRRGMKCSFDGSFGRREWVRPIQPKPEKTSVKKTIRK